ncbi:MAG: hypothetical protein KIT27_03980 [Legionellales bacterium]|nr:hypothetical protein [Legionellales bacterium]
MTHTTVSTSTPVTSKQTPSFDKSEFVEISLEEENTKQQDIFPDSAWFENGRIVSSLSTTTLGSLNNSSSSSTASLECGNSQVIGVDVSGNVEETRKNPIYSQEDLRFHKFIHQVKLVHLDQLFGDGYSAEKELVKLAAEIFTHAPKDNIPKRFAKKSELKNNLIILHGFNYIAEISAHSKNKPFYLEDPYFQLLIAKAKLAVWLNQVKTKFWQTDHNVRCIEEVQQALLTSYTNQEIQTNLDTLATNYQSRFPVLDSIVQTLKQWWNNWFECLYKVNPEKQKPECIVELEQENFLTKFGFAGV